MKRSISDLPFQEKIDTIHEQVIRGSLRSVRKMLDKKGWATARDHYGHTPLHKAVMANQDEILRFIVQTYPDLLDERDNVRRIPIIACYGALIPIALNL